MPVTTTRFTASILFVGARAHQLNSVVSVGCPLIQDRLPLIRGRDATDLPMLNSFGSHVLQRFEVVTEEVGAGARQISASSASPRLVPSDRGAHIAA